MRRMRDEQPRQDVEALLSFEGMTSNRRSWRRRIRVVECVYLCFLLQFCLQKLIAVLEEPYHSLCFPLFIYLWVSRFYRYFILMI